MRTFVIAEAGVNHNGELAMALQLVETAARCGADAVKFQTFSADKLVRRGASKAEYQVATTGAGDQYTMLKALELSEIAHRKVAEHCLRCGIEFMSTAFDNSALDFLLSLGMRRIKVPSGELTNDPYLRHVASTKLPLIVSTGMATLDEVGQALAVITGEQPNPDVVLLHCTSNYPAKFSDVNLRAMQTMAHAFDVPVGYSDHTLGVSVASAAVALGAIVVEKHFTLDRTLPGPDHRASLIPSELALLVQQIRDIEVSLGTDTKAPTQSELEVRDLVRRSVTTVRPIRQGQIIESDAVWLLRPGSGIPPRQLGAVIGKVATRDLVEGTTLQWTDIQ